MSGLTRAFHGSATPALIGLRIAPTLIGPDDTLSEAERAGEAERFTAEQEVAPRQADVRVPGTTLQGMAGGSVRLSGTRSGQTRAASGLGSQHGDFGRWVEAVFDQPADRPQASQ